MQKVTNTILDDILAARAARVEQARLRVPLDSLAQAGEARKDFRSFAAALSGGGVRVIAEMKKASPSAGLLRNEYSCAALATAYEGSGAIAISVLTEEDYFQGSIGHLREARASVRLPVLRKDFIVDAYQVYESAAAGADAVLLIVAALPDKDLRTMMELSGRLKMAALVEVHTEQELSRALGAGASIIGVNNRNLKTLEVNLETSFLLREKIPAGCVAVTESGIKSAVELKRLIGSGFQAALIGESLMRSHDPGRALAELLAECRR